MAESIRRTIDGVNYKRCSKCKEWKPYEAFANSKASYIDGKLDQCKACRKKHYQQNKETYIKRSKKYKQDHPEETAQYRKEYLKRNPEKLNQWHTAFRKKFPEIKRFHNKMNRHMRRSIEQQGHINLSDWVALCTLLSNRCAYCGTQLAEQEITMDHIIPLSRGGTHSIDNVLPSCRSCNCSKGNKELERFLKGGEVID